MINELLSEISSNKKYEPEYKVIGVTIRDDKIVAEDEYLGMSSSSNSTPNSKNKILRLNKRRTARVIPAERPQTSSSSQSESDEDLLPDLYKSYVP